MNDFTQQSSFFLRNRTLSIEFYSLLSNNRNHCIWNIYFTFLTFHDIIRIITHSYRLFLICIYTSLKEIIKCSFFSLHYFFLWKKMFDKTKEVILYSSNLIIGLWYTINTKLALITRHFAESKHILCFLWLLSK